jgi:hypothetical protein
MDEMEKVRRVGQSILSRRSGEVGYKVQLLASPDSNYETSQYPVKG